MDKAELSVFAWQGDAGAVAEIIASHLPYWMGAARQIIAADSRSARAGGPGQDPADLVQEATLKLLEQWRRGEGPKSNPRSYVTAIMRNSYSNRLRSPRAQEIPLEQLGFDRSVTVTDDVRHADLSRETELMRRALDALSPDHRDVLVAVTVEGRKPGELTELFGRPAAAVSNLLVRAKHALFRQVLIEHLAEGGTECRENGEHLPKRVHEDLELHPRTDRGIPHVRECGQCQSNWRRFATILSAFGLLPLLVVTQLTGGSAPAIASDSTPPEEPAEAMSPDDISSEDASSGNDAPTPDACAPDQPAQSPAAQGLTSPPTQPAIAVASGSAGAAPVAVAVPALAAVSVNAAHASGVSGASRLTRALSSRAALGAGVACLAIAALAVGGHTFFGTWKGEEVVYSGKYAERNPYGANLDVTLDTDEHGALQAISADFTVNETTDWAVHQVTLTLSNGTRFSSASHGLACATSGEVTVCEPTAEGDTDGTFVFDVENPEPGGTFSLEIATEVDGDTGSGRATGHW